MNVECVIDQDVNKQGKLWNNKPIISYEEAKEIIKNKKIVVMAAHTAYNEISEFLEKQGFVEFKDYCRIGQFICEWFWNTKKMNCVYHVDMTITTRCTLNCRNCNMFIPYHKKHFDYTFDELKSNIDLFFERVDYVAYFGLIGGEPLLNENLYKVIEYLHENYIDKFGKITFTTNGTMIPSDKLVNVMKKYSMLMEISNYALNTNYDKKLQDLKKMLEEEKINYSIRPSLVWCDFGFPKNPFKRDAEQLKQHLAYCRPEWNGLNDGKFYYCNVSWSAEKSGKFKLSQKDYIVLEEIDSSDKAACHMISELSRGTSSFCKTCGGCGRDNTSYVKAGIQK